MKSIFYYLVQITELLEMLLAKVFAKKTLILNITLI